MAGFKEYAIAHKLNEWKMAEPGIEPLALATALVVASIEEHEQTFETLRNARNINHAEETIFNRAEDMNSSQQNEQHGKRKQRAIW